jgi:hypothetical protein
MTFLEWFHRYARFDVVGWLVIVGVGVYWEITGAIYKNRTTFTDLVRTVLPHNMLVRMLIVGAVLGVLFWHFAIQKSNYQ